MKISQAMINAGTSGFFAAACLFGSIATGYGLYDIWGESPWPISGFLILMVIGLAWVAFLCGLSVREEMRRILRISRRTVCIPQ